LGAAIEVTTAVAAVGLAIGQEFRAIQP